MESLIQEQDKLVQMGTIKSTKDQDLVAVVSNQSKGKNKSKDSKQQRVKEKKHSHVEIQEDEDKERETQVWLLNMFSSWKILFQK